MIFHEQPTLGLSALGDGNMGPSEDVRNPNRLEYFERLGIEPRSTRSVKQVHSRRVVAAEELPDIRSGLPEADGLVSGSRDLCLTITVADCVPLYLWDRNGRGFGIVHSGWKGTGIVLEAVRLLEKRYAVPPADLCAFVGPAIGPCCYRVDSGRARGFRDEWGAPAVIERGGKSYLDLPGTNRRLLERSGVGRIDVSGLCTCCSPDLGSYRRQGRAAFSRMIAFIGYLV